MTDEIAELQGKTSTVRIIGYTCALSSTLAFATSAGCSQALGGVVPTFELNAWRFGVQWLLAGTLIVVLKLKMGVDKLKVGVDREVVPWLVLLCLFYNAHNISFYEASIYLPATELICFNNAGGIVCAFFATLATIRSCRPFEVLSVSLCVFGIFLVVQPPAIFGKSVLIVTRPACHVAPLMTKSTEIDVTWTMAGVDNWNTTPGTTNQTSADLILNGTPIFHEVLGGCLAAASAVFFTGRVFITNRTLRGLNFLVITFWVAASGVVASVITMFAVEHPVYPAGSSTCQLLLFGHAVSATVAALMATVGELNIPPTMFALALSLETPLLLSAQYTALSNINPGRHNPAEVIGAIIVFAGCMFGPFYKLFKELRGEESKPDSVQLEPRNGLPNEYQSITHSDSG